jgi:hypothetical protein
MSSFLVLWIIISTTCYIFLEITNVDLVDQTVCCVNLIMITNDWVLCCCWILCHVCICSLCHLCLALYIACCSLFPLNLHAGGFYVNRDEALPWEIAFVCLELSTVIKYLVAVARTSTIWAWYEHDYTWTGLSMSAFHPSIPYWRIESLFAWSVRQLSDLGEENGATIIVKWWQR